jgi:Domain of unknown function (DUF1905)
MAKTLVKTFKATLERGQASLGWTIIRVPRHVTDTWQPCSRVRVKGEIKREGGKGFAFRTTLFPTGNGDFTLLVNKRMQKGAGVSLGSVAVFRLEPDNEVREVAIALELKEILADVPSLRRPAYSRSGLCSCPACPPGMAADDPQPAPRTSLGHLRLPQPRIAPAAHR